MQVRMRRAKRFVGSVVAPGDKSISHRALLFNALAENSSEVRHLAPGADVRSTASCLQQLGVPLTWDGDSVRMQGVGLNGFKPPGVALDCGNSGTTMRLFSG